MTALDELVDTLLYEGYALYPYTPSAAKNATPTPFGIVYPPAYAGENPPASDRLELRCLVRSADEPELDAEVRFLQWSGDGHSATERRAGPGELDFPPLRGRVTLEVEQVGPRLRRATLRVENLTPAPDGLGRADALRLALLSTHPLLRVTGGAFVSPLEADGCESVNTWPVLASPADDVVLGAAIVLPDHPQLAPESRGSLFDGTEIEEALLLHVHALSDGERAEIDRDDPAVREMVARASATTPDDLLALHAAMKPARDPRAGEDEAVVDGVVFRPGQRVVLRPKPGRDPSDFLLAGRSATIDRIYVDLEGRTYLGVTVEDDPVQALMRDSGRFLFFFADEVEAAA